MFITLYGPDSWRRKEKKREIITEFKKKYPASSIGFFDFSEEKNISNFFSFIDNQSIFEPAKLAILENVFDKKDLALQMKLLSESKIIILILSSEKPLGEWSFLLKSPNRHQEFTFLRGRNWEFFVRKQVSNLGVRLSLPVLDFFVRYFEGDSWRLITELQKLSNLPQKTIKEEDLRDLSLEVTPIFWDLALQLKNPKTAQRLTALEKFFLSGEPPAKIFNIISSFWPEKNSDLAEYDLAIKSGKIDYEEALLDLVL